MDPLQKVEEIRKTHLSLAARQGNIHKSSSIRNPLLRPAFRRLLLLLRLNLKKQPKFSFKF